MITPSAAFRVVLVLSLCLLTAQGARGQAQDRMLLREATEDALHGGDIERALRACYKLVEADDYRQRSVEAIARVLTLCLAQGRTNVARRVADEWCKAARDKDRVHLILAKTYTACGLPALALDQCSRAIAGNPENADAYEARGQVHLLQGKPEDASADFERALALDEECLPAHIGLARVMLAQGRPGQQGRLGGERRHSPIVVRTMPRNGDTRVPPNTSVIRVTFDRPMGRGYSFSGSFGGKWPKCVGKPSFGPTGRVFSIPVRLTPDTVYALKINDCAPPNINFMDRQGKAALPFVLTFVTLPAAAAKPQ